MGKDYLDEQGITVNREDYDLLYSGKLEEGMSLEGIFTKFNLDRPEDFRGHSLSVSDVVVINRDGTETAHYVDSFGFTDLPEFFQEKVAEEEISAPVQAVSLAERIADYDSIKSNIFIQLIPKEGNEDLLEQAVHRDMEDMAVIYKIALKETEEGLLTGTLKNSLLEEYGITEEQVYQDALITTEQRFPSSLININEQIRMIIPEIEVFGIEPEEMGPSMYVASNTTGRYGATVILYPGFLEQTAEELQGSFYILPSSQHEVIFIPDRGAVVVEELESMVREVNQMDAVGPDKLSDTVLRYDAQRKVLERAEDIHAAYVEEVLSNEDTELAYEVGDRYLLIHETDEGYDYTFYGKNYLEIDGGIYTNPNVSIKEALEDILEGEGFLLDDCTELDYEDIDAEVELAEEEHFKKVMLETNCPDSIFEEYESLKDSTEYGGAAMKIGNLYLTVQPVEEGYDYIFYDGNLNEINGNVYENPDISIQEATREIIDDEQLINEICTPIGYKEFEAMTIKHSRDLLATETTPTSQIGRKEAALNGQRRAEIEELVLNYAQSQLEEMSLEEDVDVLGARVYGSRTREGLYKADSDIDVVLSYKGWFPEDSFFNALHEHGLSVAGMPVDINPISVEETGTLEDYLNRADQYLDEKEQSMREPIGRTTYASGEEFVFYDKEAFLHEIDEELEYRNTTGFRYTILADDLELRKAVDDRVYNLIGEENPNDLAHYQETQESFLKEKEALQLATEIDTLSETLDPYEYRDNVEDKETQILAVQADLLTGGEKVEEMKTWFQDYLDDEELAGQVEEILAKIEAFETNIEQPGVDVEAVVPEKEPSISFYVAECMEYPILGIYQDNLTMEEALEIYEQIPGERMNGIKGVGFRLDDGGIYDGDYELMAAGKVDIEAINCIEHYKNSALVQEAIIKMQTYLDEQKEKDPVHIETEEVQRKQEPMKYEQHEEPAGKTIEATSKPEPVQTQIKKPETKQEKGNGKKESVLQALRDRQAKLKAQEKEKSKDKSQAHKKGNMEL